MTFLLGLMLGVTFGALLVALAVVATDALDPWT